MTLGLTDEQQGALAVLATVVDTTAYLAGGVAVAARLGHRAERLPGFALPLASLDDLLCMKLAAIAGRGARRDFWDLHALLLSLNSGLEPALDLYVQKYPTEDLGHVLKSLVYFLDARQEPLPSTLSASHWEEIEVYFQREILAFR